MRRDGVASSGASMKGGYTTLAAWGTLLAICEGGTRHMMECLLFIRLRATYNWPWAKHIILQIKTNARESLTLRFINCQGVGKAERKLDATGFDTLTTDLGVEASSWHEDNGWMMGEELNLDNTRIGRNFQQNTVLTVNETPPKFKFLASMARSFVQRISS